MLVLVILGLTFAAAIAYTRYVKRAMPSGLWDWYHNLVSAVISIALGLAAGFCVYYLQRAQDDARNRADLTVLLQQELSDMRSVLSTGEPAAITAGTETFRPVVTFLQPLVLAWNQHSCDQPPFGSGVPQTAAKHPRQGEVVKLRYIVGMTLQEAAEALGISAGAAWDLSVHARAWLYREIAGARH